jgi:hypothetical protein
VPTHELEPYVLEYAHRFEAEALMQGHTRLVWQGDDRECIAEALETQDLEQRRVEGARHAPPLGLGPDVRRNFDGPLVRWP